MAKGKLKVGDQVDVQITIFIKSASAGGKLVVYVGHVRFLWTADRR